ncbi:MAG: phosphoribosylformylglycinamidine cyclo-ligase [Planctomycetota bacterium]|jgi:phosphoribosylformylglycinamidine cyclo-ligase
MAKKGLTYKDAGVDIDAGNELVSTYMHSMRSTFGPQVLQNDGGFAGLFRLRGTQGLFERKISDPLLVSATDGVGTKLKIAFAMDKHDTVGIDLVAMSINDILVQGADPLFFLDYVATGKVEKKVLAEIVTGISEGCKQAGCALLGGETAELPGFYQEGEYDLAGFGVGVVERRKVIDGQSVEAGDVILGLPSSGIHSNGYSLARKALLEAGKMSLETEVEELGCTLGEELLRPTKIYAQPIVSILRSYKVKKPVKALAHITGGGLIENIPRVLPANCNAEISLSSFKTPEIFKLVAKCGNVAEKELYRVFNMGIGMVMVVSEVSAASIIEKMHKQNQECIRIGTIVNGGKKVRLLK